MSKSIDHRIVDMQFNNRQFEAGIRETLDSLAQLKRGLELDGASRGLTDLSRASSDFDLDGMAEAIEKISDRFSTLGIIGMTALANITNAAMDTGRELVKSLSTDQIVAGFSKYEKKTTSVQTIMNATGMSLEEVNEQLDRLLWFTDETSYSFTDMVDTVGKFTATGVDLESSVTAMMGIANWAAVSGQNTNEAGRAMYNLAQSLSSGKVKLIDWKSIELANMATKEFKDTVIETAIELGILEEFNMGDGVLSGVFQPEPGPSGKEKKPVLIDYKNFGASLEHQWFTSDVLLAALDKYGGYSEEIYKVATKDGLLAAEAMRIVSDEGMELGAKAFKAAQQAKTFTEAIRATKDAVSTGWMKSAEYVFGDYEESVELWSAVTEGLWDIFASGAEARNEMFSEWKELGGRDDVLEGLVNIYDTLSSIAEAAGEAFRAIFPAMTGERLADLSRRFKEFTERFKMEDKNLENFKDTLGGIFSVLNLVKDAIFGVFRIFGKVIKIFQPANNGILAITGAIGRWLSSIAEAISEGDIFAGLLSAITGPLTALSSIFGALGGNIKGAFSKQLERISEAFNFLAISLRFLKAGKTETALEALSFGFDRLFGRHIGKVLTYFVEYLGKGIGAIAKYIRRVGEAFDFLAIALDFIKAGNLEKGFQAVSFAFERIFGSKVGKLLTSFAKGITKYIIGVGEAFEFLAISLRFLRAGHIGTAIEALSFAFDRLFGPKLGKAMTYFVEYAGKAIWGLWVIVGGVVLSITNAIKSIAGIDTRGVSVFAENAAAGLSPLERTSAKITGAWLRIIEAVQKAWEFVKTHLSKLWEKLKVMFSGMTFKDVLDVINTFLTGGLIVAFMRFTDSMRRITDTLNHFKRGFIYILEDVGGVLRAYQRDINAGAIIKIAIALAILTGSLLVLSMIKQEKLTSALTILTIVLVELVTALAILSRFPVLKSTMALIGISVALVILAGAILVLSRIDPDKAMNSMVTIAALSGILIGISKLMAKNLDSLAKGAFGFIILAIAIRFLITSVEILGKMDPGVVTQGIFSIVGLMAAMVFFVRTMNTSNLKPVSAIVFIALARAIQTLSTVVEILGKLPLGTLVKGLLAMTAMLAVLVVAANAIPQDKMIAASIGLVIMGGAMLILQKVLQRFGEMSLKTIGKGLLGLAGSLLIMTTALVVLSQPGAIAGAIALVIMSTALAMLIPVLIGLGLIPFDILFKGLVGLAGIFVVLGLAGLILGPLAPVIFILATSVLFLATAMWLVGAGFFKFVLGLTALIAVGSAGVMAITGLVLGIAALFPEIARKLGEGFIALLEVIAKSAPVLVATFITVLGSLLDATIAVIPKAVDAILLLILRLMETLYHHIPHLTQVGIALLVAFLHGLGVMTEELVKAGLTIVLAFLRGVASKMGDIVDTAFQIIISFINGLAEAIRNNSAALADAIGNLVLAIIEGFKSFVDSFIDVGKEIIGNIMQGMKNKAKDMKDGAVNVVKGMANSVLTFLGIRSPSKRFAEIGENIGEGLIVGMEHMTGKVNKTSKGLGETALDAMSKTLGSVSESLTSDVGLLQPTIRPVLDMSTLVKDLQTTFSKTQTVGMEPVLNQQLAAAIAGGGPTSLKIDMGRYLDDLKDLVQEVAASSKVDLSGTLSVQVKNDKGEIIGVANKAVMDLLRRGSRF